MDFEWIVAHDMETGSNPPVFYPYFKPNYITIQTKDAGPAVSESSLAANFRMDLLSGIWTRATWVRFGL